LLDIVGSIEIGAIAHECFDCGLYHFGAHLIPETFRPSYLSENQHYEDRAEILVLTSTARTVFPAIRYVTNDLIVGFTRRRCHGEMILGFEKIVGRAGNELKNGEKLSLYDISEAVHTFIPGSIFEIHKDPKKFIIKICSPEFTVDKAEKIKSLIKQTNPDVEQMIASSLVSDIEVCRIASDELSPRSAKKSFLIKR
jgi:phenylacetate-coenzyme A ligase PaaK-like adenylate-forming protein